MACEYETWFSDCSPEELHLKHKFLGNVVISELASERKRKGSEDNHLPLYFGPSFESIW